MPGSKQACPKSAACWSPSTPEIGSPSSTAPAGPRSGRWAVPKRPAEGRTSGRVCRGTPKRAQRLVGPGEGGRIEQHGAAGVGGVRGELAPLRAPGQVPQQPAVDRPEGEVGGRGAEGEFPVTQEPGDLRGGEIRVEHQPRGLPHHREMAGLLELGADVGRAPVLPDDGPVQRLPVERSNATRVSRWLVMPMAATVPPRIGEAASHLGQGGAHGLPDLDRIVLDPPRAREILGELPVGHVDHPRLFVDDESPHPGRPGIDGDHVAHLREASEPRSAGGPWLRTNPGCKGALTPARRANHREQPLTCADEGSLSLTRT